MKTDVKLFIEKSSFIEIVVLLFRKPYSRAGSFQNLGVIPPPPPPIGIGLTYLPKLGGNQSPHIRLYTGAPDLTMDSF